MYFLSGNTADDTLILEIKRSATTTEVCLVCGSKKSLSCYTEVERCEILMSHGIFISDRCKHCSDHKNFDLSSLPDSEWTHEFNSHQLNAMHALVQSHKKHELKKKAKIAKEQKRMKLEVSVTPNEIVLSELQIQELIAISPTLTKIVNTSSLSRATIILKIYFMKLRKGLTMDELHLKFKLSLVTLRKFLRLAREALTRHTRQLHCDNDPKRLLTIWDGTYIFAEKSGNFAFQKKSWCGFKNRNLVKPMVVVCPDGYIVDIFCAYPATANDAKIIETIFATEPDVMRILQPKDVILADRAFRNCPISLKKYNFTWKLPSMSENGRQLSTQEANSSRLVTRCRWPVEAVNGHIKSIWRIFEKRWRTGALKYLETDIHIAAAILNKYLHTPLLSDGDDEIITKRMLDKFYAQSKPAFNAIVNNKNGFQKELKRIGKFTLVDPNKFQFPRISTYEMRKFIGFGTYQVEQAKRYTISHMENHSGVFECKTCHVDLVRQYFCYQIKDNGLKMPALIVANLSSRHRSGVKYETFVFFDNAKRGAEAIVSYCCGCINGQRTVGCCSHVMTIIYYFGYARHLDKIRAISTGLNSLLRNTI